MAHPTYLAWQLDWPVFVKQPFSAQGKNWKRGDHFPWAEMHLGADKIATLYNSNYLYHNAELEVQNKVGDRLSEMNNEQLNKLMVLLNAKVKSKTSSTTEYTKKKCKFSKIEDKQRGLLRRFLNMNGWITEDFYEYRDEILKD